MRRKEPCKNKSVKNMLAKLHKDSASGKTILAVCDTEIFGKSVSEGKIQLELGNNFFRGVERTDEEILDLFCKVDMVNLAGKNAVLLGIKSGIIEKSGVRKVKDIPYAMMMRL